MAVKPVTTWADKYKEYFDEVFKKYADGEDGTALAQEAWGKFLEDVATGISGLPPFLSDGTVGNNFSPLGFSPALGPPAVALMLATAWMNWFNSITWTVPTAPPPGFLVVQTVTSSPLGVAAAYGILLAGLLAEFLAPLPPPGPAGAKIKEVAIATLFYTATVSAGIQLVGLAPGAPPPPLIIPFAPAL